MVESLSWDALLLEMLQNTMGSRPRLTSIRCTSTETLPITSVVLSSQLLLAHIQLEQLVYLPPLASKCRLLAFTETKVSVSAKVPLLFAQRLC